MKSRSPPVGRQASGMVPLGVKKTMSRFWMRPSAWEVSGRSMADRKGKTDGDAPGTPQQGSSRQGTGHQGLPTAERNAGDATVARTSDSMSRSALAKVAAASSISHSSPSASRRPWAKRNHCREKHS